MTAIQLKNSDLKLSDLKLMAVRVAVLYMKQGIISTADGSVFVIKEMSSSNKQSAERHNNSLSPAFNIYVAYNYKQEAAKQ